MNMKIYDDFRLLSINTTDCSVGLIVVSFSG